MFNFGLFHFKGQKEGEKVIAVIHRHWFNILQKFFAAFLMAIFLLGSYGILPALFPALNKPAFNGLFLFLENLFAMVVWIVFFMIWIDYYFDVWIITNKRIVNTEQKGLFSRETSEVELDKIQDVSTEIMGIIPTFLNYGDVQIQTAAHQEKFMFRQVSNPYATKDLIMRLNKRHRQTEAEELRSIIHEK